MKKLYIITALITLAVATVSFAVGPVFSYGTPEVYEMTFNKLTMVKNDGTEVIINNTPATEDLAAVNPSTFIGEVLGGSIPAGTYTQINSTVSMEIVIKGAVLNTVDDKIYYTTVTTVPVTVYPPGTAVEDQIPGTGCVPGVFDPAGVNPNGVVDAEDWYDDGAPIQAGQPAYAAATIKPPTVGDTYTQSIPGEEVVAEGDLIDETMEIDLTDSIQLYDDNGGTLLLFPGPPAINFVD